MNYMNQELSLNDFNKFATIFPINRERHEDTTCPDYKGKF
jgi:hypothetical protein